MRKVAITSSTAPAKPRSEKYPVGASVTRTSGGSTIIQGGGESVDIVMARAVARLNILDELCLPLVKKNGYFLSLKGRQAPEEVKEAKKGIQLLGGQIESTHDFTLANHDDFRSNIIIKKVKETPKKYPRMFSKIKKSPL